MVKYKASIGPYFWGFYVRGSRLAKVWAISAKTQLFAGRFLVGCVWLLGGDTNKNQQESMNQQSTTNNKQ